MRSLSTWRSRALAFGMITALGRAAASQMPGAPVLQNAFANPGITAAANIASVGAASSYALAGAFAPSSGRFQFSLGVGVQTRRETPVRTVYGVRANFPVYGAARSFGASIFAGYGGLAGRELDSTSAKALIPAGATLSYRLGLGTSRGVSVYASPIYEWVTRGDGAGNTSAFRGALGLDLGVTSSIGVTVGVELGTKYDASTGKPSGTAFGAAVSYALGKRS